MSSGVTVGSAIESKSAIRSLQVLVPESVFGWFSRLWACLRTRVRLPEVCVAIRELGKDYRVRERAGSAPTTRLEASTTIFEALPRLLVHQRLSECIGFPIVNQSGQACQTSKIASLFTAELSLVTRGHATAVILHRACL